ncbi:MAG: nitroreductase family protein [Candidatus Brocadiae bacterium]|nr:nitroreductase family protein [Candidatus Brocadiia bacterium]
MGTKSVLALRLVCVALLIGVAFASAQEAKQLELPEPQTDGGRPLMQVLKDRKSLRSYSSRALPPQELSNLLWAACGVNRPDSGKRTAPTARNMQQIDVYVATAEGLYLFDAKAHALNLVLEKDIRAMTGTQSFVAEAPVNLVFVSDHARMGGSSQASKDFYSATDTGFISQNVYLYCASEGLATVVRGLVDRPKLAKEMGLRANQKIILAQSVGYPR